MSMKWSRGLSDEQKDAASHTGKHARLLAGPGTGKTLTLTRRILRLLESGVEPTKILAFTFTRFAAAELKRRVTKDLGDADVTLPRISTLHSYALRELLRNESRIKLPQPVRIADDWEEENIILIEIQRLLREAKKRTRELFARLAADWQQLTADRQDWERNFPDAKFLGTWQEHREIYGYTLRAELVYQLKTSLEEGDSELEGPPDHVLADEYQDLNPCDLAVVRHLGTLGCEIYAAGDDDQSIYGFRQAEPEGIRRFPTEFTPSRQLGLKECKRCDKEILDFALYVARQDPRREEKPLESTSNQTGEVRVLRFRDGDSEARGVGLLCRWLVNRKKLKPHEILILLRTDRRRLFSDPIRAALLTARLPVNVASNPLEPLDTDAGREFLALLRLIARKSDHLAWRSILEVRKNGLGEATFAAIYEIARQQSVPFFEALKKIAGKPSLIGTKGVTVRAEVEKIRSKIKQYGSPPEEDLFNWLGHIASEEISEKQSRKDILEIFKKAAKGSDIEGLEDLIRAVTVSLGDKEQDLRENVISVMTMHQAKGLTATAVVVAATEDEYIPGRASGRFVDDERRLLYVSLTRARHHLFVTYANRRAGQQRYSGRTSGHPARHFTRFLSGGPIQPGQGESFVSSLK